MIPSVLSSQVETGLSDFIKTTFPVTNPFFHGVIDTLFERDKFAKGPYVSIKLPFRTGTVGKNYFENIPMKFDPYLHQEQAFKRLTSSGSNSTIVATGTGSGKTEAFLYPILEYCRQNVSDHGIKAIIVYPMNALANDQSKRLARLIEFNSNLKNKVTVGLYVGSKSHESDEKIVETTQMSVDKVITHKDTLRKSPPDILLTNYKMLDYLLLRQEDYPLWQNNSPETLKFIVVDELHTFDGAQGTDLACLIRRLKDRLKTPKKYLSCVGTSATLGGDTDFEKLQTFAAQVFGEKFIAGSVITESLLTIGEFFEGYFTKRIAMPTKDDSSLLDPSNYDSMNDYVKGQYKIWFNEDIDNYDDAQWRLELSTKLKESLFFRNFMELLKNKVLPIQDIITEMSKASSDFVDADVDYKLNIINSIACLISEARIGIEGNVFPFLNVRFQFWVRELRRMVSSVDHNPSLKFSDDLNQQELKKHLPIVYCNECGTMGWGGSKRKVDDFINPDLQLFYQNFFRNNPTTVFLFPLNKDETEKTEIIFYQKLCGNCLILSPSSDNECSSCGHDDKLIPVKVINEIIKRKNNTEISRDCPFCKSSNGLTILGSRSASLISVAISQLFSSTYNDDKKLITFSDSVQDASHRAGFFAARTFKFNFRTALQQFLIQNNDPLKLSELPKMFWDYYLLKYSEEEFITTFLPPDLEYLDDYEALLEKKKLPADSKLLDILYQRIEWEIYAEYGYNARIGRTLEKTNSSIAALDLDKIQSVSNHLLELLKNKNGTFANITDEQFLGFILGFITQLKNKGGIYQPLLKEYLEDWGNYYRLWIQLPLPKYGKNSRTPSFITTKQKTRLEALLSSYSKQESWHQEWLAKLNPLIPDFAFDVYKEILGELVNAGILEVREKDNENIWGLKPEALFVKLSVAQMKCSQCGQIISVSNSEKVYWIGNKCLKRGCYGSFTSAEKTEDYYKKLYASGNIRRLFAKEHTGLLPRKKREDLEKEFIESQYLWSTNLLSCTPTLEMGIDIGDLSSSILCAVPPSQSNYLQRIGRTGRRDGNSLNMTVATGRPHDLYFFDKPTEMMSGEVLPPGIFLNAPAVLERQFIAFCMDKWLESSSSLVKLPRKLSNVFRNINNPSEKKLFPYNFLNFIDANRTDLFNRFVQLFDEDLQEESIEYLKVFVEGNDKKDTSLSYKIINALYNLKKEVESLRKRVQNLTRVINEKEAIEVKDENQKEELKDLKREKASLNAIIRSIREKNIFNFFTDEGLLPNYSFPETGVILRSIIYRKKGNENEGQKYETKLFEYERPSSTAIHELAPYNSFYAEGRKVTIDQVDMNTAQVEEWRFCNKCSRIELIDTHGEQYSSCPNCGSTFWSDSSQKRRMLKIKHVIASTSDRNSRSYDDKDDREPSFYNKHLFVEVAKQNILKAFKIDDEQFPFGFEFIQKADFREINFGQRDTSGETIDIASTKISQKGFTICSSCGKVQDGNNGIKHTPICQHKNSKQDDNVSNFLYMYRSFSSEAVRILLPITSFSDDSAKVNSLMAAMYLGLKKKYQGNIDHLQLTTYDEPLENSSYRKKYLVIFDTVPGGTGYLKDIMLNHTFLFEIFELALTTLIECNCDNSLEKDGCYRCIMSYRFSYEMANISKKYAVDILNGILRNKNKIIEIESVNDIDINPLFDSELEAKFIEALRRSKFSVKQDIVNGKPGWFIKKEENGFYIEPQVNLGLAKGIKVSSKADFVFYPERATSNRKPIVVFTDGFSYHASVENGNLRIGKDTAQRMAIVRSGNYHVWSLTWDDVENVFEEKIHYYDNYSHNSEIFEKYIDHYDRQYNLKKLFNLPKENSFELLSRFLVDPDITSWQVYSFFSILSSMQPHIVKLSRNEIEKAIEVMFNKSNISEFPKFNNNETENNLFSIREDLYDNDLVQKRILGYCKTDNVTNVELEGLTYIFRLFDDHETAAIADFKKAWIGFLRLYNLYQFIPNAIFITSQGLENSDYDNLELLKQQNLDSGISNQIKEFKEITVTEVHQIIDYIFSNNIPLPDVGHELEDKKGLIIATSELAWVVKKVAIVLSDNFEKEAFSNNGWEVYLYSDIIESLETLKKISTKDNNVTTK